MTNALATIAAALQLATTQDAAMWQALAQLESGNNPQAHGRAGEVGAHQIMRSVWKQATSVPITEATNQAVELAVARVVQAKRVEAFTKRMGRKPTPGEWYCLWHKPKFACNMRPKDIEIGERFNNLYEKNKNTR